MTELSPAAKAVDDAFWKTISDKWNMYDKHRAKLAAALRAAADECDLDWTGPTVMHHLYAIADELETHQ
jgi:hypothetical protein